MNADEKNTLYRIKKNDHYGFINSKGEIIIEPKLVGAKDFSEELALVNDFHNEVFINKEGEMVLDPDFDSISKFSDGLSRVMLKSQTENGFISKYGYINKEGAIVINPVYYYATDFNEGYALAIKYVQNKANHSSNWNLILLDIEGNETYLEHIEVAHVTDIHEFSEGYAVVIPSRFKQPLLIDTRENIVIKEGFNYIGTFKEGLAPVEVNLSIQFSNEKEPDHKYGYIDDTGKIVIEPQFVNAFEFSEGYAAVIGLTDYNTPKMGYINLHGDIMIDFQYEYGGDFSNGLAPVLQDDLWGYINYQGEMVIEPQFDYAWKFVNGIAKVNVGDRFGYINTKGQYIWNPTK